MGGYYAEAAGEPADVRAAIREHYRPRFAGDELPGGNAAGKCVAIAEEARHRLRHLCHPRAAHRQL